MSRNSTPMPELKKRVLRVMTKKPLSAVELAAKLNRNLRNGQVPYNARGIGRALAGIVGDGDASKSNERVPRYAKP